MDSQIIELDFPSSNPNTKPQNFLHILSRIAALNSKQNSKLSANIAQLLLRLIFLHLILWSNQKYMSLQQTLVCLESRERGKKRKKEKDNEEGKEKERKKGREEGKEREKKALLIFWTYPNTMWSYRMYQSLFTNVLCSELQTFFQG